MTPAARLSAAIDILDDVLGGQPAEKLLTTWARGNRYAGSKDRAAIRDIVFQALRCRRSFAALGGGDTGRGLVLGGLRAEGVDPATLFTGERFAPARLSDAEAALRQTLDDLPELDALDCPDWLAPGLRASLGAEFAPVMQALRHRAPVFARVNIRHASRDHAIRALADEGILARPHPLSPTALELLEGARKLQNSAAYRDGMVELQDAASQAVTDLLPLEAGQRVLDYCAGGGGKTLAMAARVKARFFAHDAAPRRLRDLPQRARRAGISVSLLDPAQLSGQSPFDMVLCDVPCSGSGAFRRSPEGKWRLSAEMLDRLLHTQAEILDQAAAIVAPGGCLAYATCSMLEAENAVQVRAFTDRAPDFRLVTDRRFTPLDGADGFYVAVMRRA